MSPWHFFLSFFLSLRELQNWAVAKNPASSDRLPGFETQPCGLGKLFDLLVPQLPHLWGGDLKELTWQGFCEGSMRWYLVFVIIVTWSKSLLLSLAHLWNGQEVQRQIQGQPDFLVQSPPYFHWLLLFFWSRITASCVHMSFPIILSGIRVNKTWW